MVQIIPECLAKLRAEIVTLLYIPHGSDNTMGNTT